MWEIEQMWVNRNNAGVAIGVSEAAPAAMNIHDKYRQDIVVRTLLRAKEQTEKALMYLTANDRNPEQLATAGLVLEHINIALEHLGVAES